MPVSVTMPQLGESVTEGTVTRWLKKEGERVEADEPLLEVSTDKVDTEIPSPSAGYLTKIIVAEDETVEVGAELALIDSEAGAAPAAAEAAPAAPEPAPQPEPEPEPAPAPQAAAPEPEPAPAPISSIPQPAPAVVTPQPAPQAQPAPQPQAQPAPQPQAQPAQPAPAAEPTPLPSSGESPYVTPLVRKLAAEHGVDLDALTGTGVGGRIRKQDVIEAARVQREQAAAPAAPAAPQAAPAEAPAAPAAAAPAASEVRVDTTLRGRTEKMSRLRQTIAKRMVESLQVSAQLTTVVEVDVTRIARLRDQAKGEFLRREGVKLSFMPFFAIAAIEALKQHPKLNATINSETNEVTYFDVEHLGFATDTERGLLVPVIKNAGDLNIAGLARKIADLAERTRTNKVSPDEITGGTFTLTNTGSRGALFDTPILNQPQVGMLGTGAVVKRPVVVDTPEGEVIAVRSMVYLALSYDHRLVDGADAARFLTTIKRRLEEGRFEAQLGLA
ncbi:2-oxoglutarate dehydrogenase, E2 component, dihydrolipoamide succinyltransferase [Microbispora cellulosiformans]|uniref:Dihydrolipoamide acetyltransferase component of pyruvate dehydrogenase complex n=1 Tax=Microbispora cellulosiformans TaxID=2614688 RepID=A0A5J5K7H5_9ACTN|nr:2-oxoglutarate dehydrogenase, E2 component, dihydrolipoamide succinyltransferase [Microbispora cellulosiformans]KAA9379758.1 2-oxoglutarate dehydrogenase, E2 component, dihydrolipoamide succinyltransferase [Microbispora cellulosiformans]